MRYLLHTSLVIVEILTIPLFTRSVAQTHWWDTMVLKTPLAAVPQSGPVATLSPTSLSFGNQQTGTVSAGQTVTLTNTGQSVLSITTIEIVGSNLKNFSQSHTCKSSLAAGANCTIVVTFTPVTVGSQTKTLEVVDNAVGSPQTVSLSGVGTVPAIAFSPSTFPSGGGTSLSFAGVAIGSSSSPQSVTLTNTGNAPLTITSIVTSGDFSQENTCGNSVGAGSSCSINVTFTPTAVWSRSGTVVISDNVAGSPQQVILLAGMGNSGAKASLSASSLTFANQTIGTTGAAQSVELTNTGSTELNINSIVATGDFAQTNTCGSSLSAGTNCTITVTFTPSYVNKRTGYITVNDTDPTFLQSVSLSGQGTKPSSTVGVNPGVVSITPTQSQQFTATISGQASTNVNWSVDGINGGNTTVGTISSSGLYTPPTTAGGHTVTATSVANPTESANAQMLVTTYAGTFTYKNDTMHTGQNLNETVLTSGNVNSNQFGKLFSYSVDGYVFAQPLYVAGVTIPGKGLHNVVYVATENDSVYAFDADDQVSQALWQASFIDTANGVTTVPAQDVELNYYDIPVQIGITSTPVIDPAMNTIFVLARTKEVSGGVTSYVQRLHALDITTGTEKPGSPVVIQAVVSGTGLGGNGSQVAFDPLRENSRPGLLLVNGTVYVAWASLEDISPWHGWVLGYSESTLQQVSVFNATPNGSAGGIWGAGGGVTADANGIIYITTGNGSFDVASGGVDYGDSVVKLGGAGGTLTVSDYFTPFNQLVLSNADWDLGSGGMMLLPDQPGPYPHLLMTGGKGSTLYQLNRDNLGKFNSTADESVLTLPGVLKSTLESGGNRAGGPAYWQEQIYYAGAATSPMQFSLVNGLISAIPIAQWTGTFGFPGSSLVVSANGNTNGILWALQTENYLSGGPAVLYAFDAANIGRVLFDTYQLASSNAAGPAVKFAVPTVANGKVYVGTQTELDVYGLLP